MSAPILVEPGGPKGHMPLWTVDSLIEDLRAEGLDARLAYEEFVGGGAIWDSVTLWVAASAGGAVISQVVTYAFKWLEDMFRKHPDVQRPRAVSIRVYEREWSELHVTIKKEAADKEPVWETPEDPEVWMPRNPGVGVYSLAHPGDRVQVRALPASELAEVSQRYVGQVGTLTHYPTMSPGAITPS